MTRCYSCICGENCFTEWVSDFKNYQTLHSSVQLNCTVVIFVKDFHQILVFRKPPSLERVWSLCSLVKKKFESVEVVIKM